MRFVGIASAIFVLAVASTSLGADATTASTSEQEAALAKRRQGDAAMQNAQAADAIVAYTEAYAVLKDPAIIYNLGRAYASVGDNVRALEHLEQFEREAPPETKARVPALGRLIFDLRQRVSTLDLFCEVEGAEVRFGERILGRTPLAPTRVAAGRGSVTVTKDGYVSAVQVIELPGGSSAHVEITLISRETSALLAIESKTPGAQAFVDDKSIGGTPSETWLTNGEHRIRVERDGFTTQTKTVVVRAGERRRLDMTLESADTVLKKWWFWTAVGTVVLGGGVVTYVALTKERSGDQGNIAPGRLISNGLRF